MLSISNYPASHNFWRAFVFCWLMSLAAVGQQAANTSSISLSFGESGKTSAAPAETNIVLAAGDIAECPYYADSEKTAKLLDKMPGIVLALGDLSYPEGSETTFRQCYSKTWGRHKERTHPAPGNHEYRTPGAAGYFQYFGAAAGDPKRGYYSFDLGGWHIISLNSECSAIGGCQQGSPEETWLREDLKHNAGKCLLAYWHVPLFSSGSEHGNSPEMKPFWDDLYASGADLVLNGHDHDYERFALQNPAGASDPAKGIREFVVGTGGGHLRSLRQQLPTTEVRNSSTFGLLKLTLQPHGYEWEFVPVAGSSFTDSGKGGCHAGH